LLERALDDGLDLPGDRDIAIRLLLGLLNEGATLVASAPNRQRERRRVTSSVDAFLERLLAPSS
jgi:hypothetical protein